MRKIARIPGKLALIAAGIIGLSITMLVAVTPAGAGNQSFVNVKARPTALLTATINGPATVWDDWTCTWTASTNISDPIYEWEMSNANTGEPVIIGTSASVSFAYDKSEGSHQGLHLRVYNLAGDQAFDDNLIGVYFLNVGNPDCP
jgi:hypothetical protein